LLTDTGEPRGVYGVPLRTDAAHAVPLAILMPTNRAVAGKVSPAACAQPAISLRRAMTSELVPFRKAILTVHPDLEDAAFRALPGGWHSRAVAVDDRLVFKFPQGEEAELALRRETSILAA